MTTAREVRVGDRTYTIEPFNGRKAILAGRMVARIAKKAPGVLERDATFQRDYAAANAVRVTRAEALGVDFWRDQLGHITEAQWDKIGGVLVIPTPPSFETRIAAGFAEVFEAAEDEVLKLLALAVVPNGDLAEAAKTGDPRDLLRDRAEQLLDAGSLGELVELAAAVGEHVRDEFRGDGLGKLRALWAGTTDPERPETKTPASGKSSPPQAETPQPAPSPPPTPPPPAPTPIPTPTTPPATSKEPTSSTGSPAPTDGPTNGSSTGSPGGSSVLSASG